MFKGIDAHSIDIEGLNPVTPDIDKSCYYFRVLGSDIV